MDPLATVPDMASYVQGGPIAPDDPSALLYLRLASSAVRGYLRSPVSQVVADVQVLDPLEAGGVALPDGPVTEVTAVECLIDCTWTDVTNRVTISKAKGLIRPAPGVYDVRWPWLDETWRVTYTHGYSPIPDDIVTVTAQLAGEAYSNAAGIDQLQTGFERVTYSQIPGLTDLQKAALAPYVNPVIA